MRLRGIDPATPWFGCDRCADFDTPAGDFAETFALLLLGPKDFRGRIAPPPNRTQISELETSTCTIACRYSLVDSMLAPEI